MLVTMGEGSGTPTEPQHTPSPEAQQTLLTATSSPSLPPVTTVTIPTTSTLPSDSTPRVTTLAADEGSMQHKLIELTDLCTRLQRQQDEMASKITAQDLEIFALKARIKHLEDKDGGYDDPSREDATIKGRRLETGEEAEVATVSIPPAGEIHPISVPTGSGVVLTASPIFTTATVTTPYSRRKCKEKMVESKTPKKKKLQEQIYVKMARQNNETVAKYLQEYEQFATDLSIRERIELINDLVKYQDNYAKVLKYQIQQRKPLSKKQQKELYMSVLRSNAGWKTRHFKGMSLEEIREKFIPVWKQIEDFVPMGSKEEGERFKRKGISLEQDSAKKVKTSEEVSEEDLKEMMHLVPVEEVYVEALQEDLNQLWALVKETFNIRPTTSDKEKELWVELKRLYEPDIEDQL
nr:hypothetical protein [Tanacetum cinerariifolium]